MIDFLTQINAIGILECFGMGVLFVASMGVAAIIIGEGADRCPRITALILFGIPVLFALRRIIIGLM